MVKLTFSSKNLSKLIDSGRNKIVKNKNLPSNTIGLSDKIIENLDVEVNTSRISDEGIQLYVETPEGHTYEINSNEIVESESPIELPKCKYNKLSSQIEDLKNLKIYNKTYTFKN